ncbi:hypothetical protein DdX_04068 [Ditylenchus destructor]|uniref:Uncharacterized protein n=1 Tax=Ditylenchus destructor TaxID=166010 RepID=A0AAD4NEX3_9BILA|nr:hypothetical protein DdX_04068 [Ditylenchus destructor]
MYTMVSNKNNLDNMSHSPYPLHERREKQEPLKVSLVQSSDSVQVLPHGANMPLHIKVGGLHYLYARGFPIFYKRRRRLYPYTMQSSTAQYVPILKEKLVPKYGI